MKSVINERGKNAHIIGPLRMFHPNLGYPSLLDHIVDSQLNCDSSFLQMCCTHGGTTCTILSSHITVVPMNVGIDVG